jgi:hypothetical protein
MSPVSSVTSIVKINKVVISIVIVSTGWVARINNIHKINRLLLTLLFPKLIDYFCYCQNGVGSLPFVLVKWVGGSPTMFMKKHHLTVLFYWMGTDCQPSYSQHFIFFVTLGPISYSVCTWYVFYPCVMFHPSLFSQFKMKCCKHNTISLLM